MSAAADLLAEAIRLGVHLSRHGDKLRVTGAVSAVTPELRERLAANKAGLLALVSVESRTAQGSDRLLAALLAEYLPDGLLGCDDADPAALTELEPEVVVAYVRALHATAEREAGRVPLGWDHAAHCAGCGPVWLWTPGRVAACPWCWNRRAHKPLPRPRVRCADCQHYIADAINPDAGLGACAANRTPGRTECAPWPMAQRICGEHRPRGEE